MNNVTLTFTARTAKEFTLSLQDQTILISKKEIKSLNRYVEPLPINLDTYKYLTNENEYMLVSEYLAMDPDDMTKNKLSFTVIRPQTIAKFVIESIDVYMTLKSKKD